MYKGYKLNIGDEATKAFSEKEILDLGTPLVLENKKIIKGSLDKFRFDEDGIIDGTVMQQEWFPEIEADIFISHSHKDEQVAIGLAGFLNKVHGLSSFIDST
ncbi:MAG: hypothetical protein H6599_12230, partial [Flavobacteriales bacterium]|nr:hypothetical protein [Flavobacteriales bacterium]